MFLIVSSLAHSGADNLLPEGVECDLANGSVCDFESVYYLIISQARLIEGGRADLASERIKDDDLSLIRPRIYPRSTRRPDSTRQHRPVCQLNLLVRSHAFLTGLSS